MSLSDPTDSRARSIRGRACDPDLSGSLMETFRLLLAFFGSQHWWPADSPFEMALGAILTQNTNWRNVERAIENLRRRNALTVEGFSRVPEPELARLIRPSGCYTVKARRLTNYVGHIEERYGGNFFASLSGGLAEKRQELLSVSGIGPETADSILLYAGGHPTFVVDAYTRRVMARHGFVQMNVGYEALRSLFMDNLPPDAPLFNEYHALIVAVGKEFCGAAGASVRGVSPLTPSQPRVGVMTSGSSRRASPTEFRTLSKAQISTFRREVLKYYRAHGRDFPWRRTDDPYNVLVSEVMLQQTQVGRVLAKWGPFVATFPDFASLAAAPLVDVLTSWRGLGYNRRALYLKEIACAVMERYAGRLPDSQDELVRLPGIGPNTAGAIIAFAFNRPAVFIETNIRSVFIHHFFPEQDSVRDAQILPLIKATLDRDNPRIWYWALMDYGVMLKETTGNPSRRSAHHARQSPFTAPTARSGGRSSGSLSRLTELSLTDIGDHRGPADAGRSNQEYVAGSLCRRIYH